jgi:hypothetical protein
MMRRLLPLLLAAACAPAPHPIETAAPLPRAPRPLIELRNAGFEAAPRPQERCAPYWGCTMHNTVDAFRFRLDGIAPFRGERSLCIERLKEETWALATQGIDAANFRGKRMRFSAEVRAEVEGGRGAGPWVRLHGVPAAEGGHFERLASRTDGWRRMALEFTVPASATQVEVGLILEGGGRGCIDEARLEVLD